MYINILYIYVGGARTRIRHTQAPKCYDTYKRLSAGYVSSCYYIFTIYTHRHVHAPNMSSKCDKKASTKTQGLTVSYTSSLRPHALVN